MRGNGHPRARLLVFGLSIVTAVAAVTAQIIEGPAGGGYGWGAVAASCVSVAVPLLVVGVLVLGGRRRLAAVAMVVMVLMLGVFLMALGGNWAGQSSTARVLDTGVADLVLVLAVGTVALEAPLLRRAGA